MSRDDALIERLFEAARQSLKKLEESKRDIISNLAIELENAGMQTEFISEEITAALEGYVSKRYINECLDKKYKKKVSDESSAGARIDDNKVTEKSHKPLVIITSGEAVDDETNEQHDQRSEARISDEVSKSINQSQKPIEQVKEFNNVIKQQGEKIEQLQAKLKAAEETDPYRLKEIVNVQAERIIEYEHKLKAAEEKTKDAEYVKLEEKLIALEEKNARLINENKQYSEAVLKRSFETATNVKTDPQQIKNYEAAISSLEEMIKQKNQEIEQLNAKIESFGHLDHFVEHQPLELNVKPAIGVLFANRGGKVILVHDGKRVLKVTGGGEK